MQHCMSPTQITKTVMMQATNTACIITDYTVCLKNPVCLYATSSNSMHQCLYGKNISLCNKTNFASQENETECLCATAHITNMSNKKL